MALLRFCTMRAYFAAIAFVAIGLLGTRAARANAWETQRRPVAGEIQRPSAQLAGCSSREAVCVHAIGEVDPALAAEAVARAEQALATLRDLELPMPPADGGLGGSYDVDLYLDPNRVGSAAYADPLFEAAGFDNASSFALVEARPGGCRFASDIARSMSQVVLLGMDPAAHDGTIAMQSSYLASMIAPCPTLEHAAVDLFQREPWHALNGAPRDALAGSMLFPLFLDSEHGMGTPAAVMNGLIAVSTQRTPGEQARFDNEPDIYDALRKVTKARKFDLGGLLIDFAVARAFLGNRSDGLHLPGIDDFGALGRPHFEWSIDYDSLPRRLAPLYAVDPTGATYLWLDVKEGDADRGLSFHAEWDDSYVFMWSLVRVDREGKEIARVDKGGIWGQRELHCTLADLSDTAGVLIVGTSLGNDDRANPYDPDDGPPREAGYFVTLRYR